MYPGSTIHERMCMTERKKFALKRLQAMKNGMCQSDTTMDATMCIVVV